MDKAALKIVQRILTLDATALTRRAHAAGHLKPYKRFQAYVRAEHIFPTPKKRLCLCGCGRKLGKGRVKWAGDACATYGNAVLNILKCHAPTIRHYLSLQYGACCCKCWVIGEPLEVDHILPVSQGGGGLYLGNYQLLCHSCHLEKTAADLVKYA